MNKLAALLRSTGAANSKGGQDTILAHINKPEARLLKLLGGSGRVDPDTGGIHFDQGDNDDSSGNSYGDGNNGTNGDGVAGDGGPSDDGVGGSVENDAPGRGNGFEDAPATPSTSSDTDVFGDPVSNDGLSGGYGAPSGGLAGAGFDAGPDDAGNGGQGWGDKDSFFAFNLSPEEQAARDAQTNAQIAGWIGYDPANTTLGDVGQGISNYFGLNQQDRNNAAPAFADENQAFTQENGANFNAPGANQWGFTQDQVGKAGDEYNSLGWQGALEGNPWSYTGLDDQSHANWGAVGNDLTSALNSPYAAAIASLTGLTPAYAVLNGIGQFARGNYTPGLSTLGGLVGGRAGSLAGGLLGEGLQGRSDHVFAGLANTALQGSGLNIGGWAQGNLGGNSLTGQVAGIAGNTLQGILAGEIGRGLDAAYESTDFNNPVSQFASTEDAYGSPDSGSMESQAASAAAGPSSASDGSYGSGGSWGGGGSNDFSDYDKIRNDFLGSKKKSRYRQPTALAELLGDTNGA